MTNLSFSLASAKVSGHGNMRLIFLALCKKCPHAASSRSRPKGSRLALPKMKMFGQRAREGELWKCLLQGAGMQHSGSGLFMDQGERQPKEVQVHLPIHCSFNKYLLSGAAGPGHSIITTIQLCLSGFSQLKGSALIILEFASSTVLKE